MKRLMTEAEFQTRQKRVGLAKTVLLPSPMVKPLIGGKAAKHGNTKCVIGGLTFQSKREGKRWMVLSVLNHTGEIEGLRWQVPFELAPAVVLDGRKKPAIRYFADFVYWDVRTQTKIIEDCKSPHLREDPVYRMKKHLMMSVHGLAVIET